MLLLKEYAHYTVDKIFKFVAYINTEMENEKEAK